MLCHQYKYFFNFLHIFFSYYNIKHNTCHYFLSLPPRTLQNNKKTPRVRRDNAERYSLPRGVSLLLFTALFFLRNYIKGNGCYCGNDNTFCNITVKVTLLITIFLCSDSFPNHGSDKPCTNQDTGNSFFGV